jgi:hypothetical protein
MKWEYLVVKWNEEVEAEQREFICNYLSEDEYELITVDNDIAYFKRLVSSDKTTMKEAVEGYFGGKVG